MCKPTDGDTDGGLTVWVAGDGLVSFVQQVVPHPPVEQLGLLDLARERRLESSVLGYCSASPRTPVPPAVLRKHGRPLPTGPYGRGKVPDTHGAVHGAPDPRLLKLPPRGACVDVTPNLVWIAQVGDCVQVLYDRGRSCARGGGRGDGSRHATKGTRAPHGRLRVRSAPPRSRDRSSRRSVIACETMKRRSAARIGVNSRDPDHRGDVGDNRLLITDPTQGLLSRGSQVRILPGVPFLSGFCRLRRLVTTPAVTSRRSDRSHRTDD